MGCEGLGGKEIEVDGTEPSEEWRREVRGSHNWSGPLTARASAGAGKGPSQGGRIRRKLGQHFPCLLGPQGAHWGPSLNCCSPRPPPVVLSLEGGKNLHFPVCFPAPGLWRQTDRETVWEKETSEDLRTHTYQSTSASGQRQRLPVYTALLLQGGSAEPGQLWPGQAA